MNREEYLIKGVRELTSLFEAQGYEVPEVKVSCSWAGGSGKKQSTIGQCWPTSLSTGKVNEIFISPAIDDSVRALDILTHEMIHAIDDCEHGHRKEFTQIMKKIGLEGKPTATHAGERLHAELAEIVSRIGEYPHQKLEQGQAKQKSRQLKASCETCGAVWRMSNTWLQQVTCCPCCGDDDNVVID